jgi:enoyl-[acyl-carrier protein] reductase I
MGFLAGKRAIIVGVASNRSIAWGIAQAMHRQGAQLAFTYQGDKLKDRVIEMASQVDSNLCFPCDVGSDEDIQNVFNELGKHWDGIDIVIHSVAFAPREQLEGRFIDTVTRDGFRLAHDISSYSFVALAKAAYPMMKGRQGALLTMSYAGAVRAIPNYNVMGAAKASLESAVRFLANDLGPEGIRVNAISAGPIKTLAAAGISGFRGMLSKAEEASPLRRNVTIDEVGNVAAFLCSDLASAVTGEITYVDAGYNILGIVA